MLLANAGLAVEIIRPALDERIAEKPLLAAGMSPRDLALALAAAKAVLVSGTHPGRMVIGGDQVLEVDGARLNKPATPDDARRQILSLAGRPHQLHAAVACAKDGAVLWQTADTASLTMRDLDPASVDRYLALAGTAALESVGGYQLEGVGIQLFEAIEGDYFTILGLPLLPLLAFLRTQGVSAL